MVFEWKGLIGNAKLVIIIIVSIVIYYYFTGISHQGAFNSRATRKNG
jgi:hypothetical protein